MTPQEYQEAVMRTCGQAGTEERLAMAIVGIADELGEVAGPIKKYLWHGHSLDKTKMIDEIGDVCWYIGLLCYALNIDLEIVLEHNIDKLRRRYPEGFSNEASMNRPV